MLKVLEAVLIVLLPLFTLTCYKEQGQIDMISSYWEYFNTCWHCNKSVSSNVV